MSEDTLRVPIRVLVLGRPGAGKGTQGERLAEVLDVPHISTGALLRAEIERDGPLGRKIANDVATGRLVADDLVATALGHRLDEPDAASRGFVLDGYPRTIAQAITLERMLAPERIVLALELVVPEREASHRLLARFVCDRCGQPAPARLGSTTNRRPDVCARCGGTLRRRSDDDVSVIRRRFQEFEHATKPLLEWLDHRRLLVTVDADRPPAEVAESVLEGVAPVLERAGLPPVPPRAVPA